VRIPRRTLARVFWRCLFLQAAWNRRGMQNLGFAYAIDPALRALYADPEVRREALRRHLCFFNCHPYTAAAILGGAIHHEERVARGEEPARSATDYKATLQGPLAAVGDGFFWTALRPFLGAAAALGTILAGWPAVVAALVLYNALALGLRARLFLAVYRGGDAVVAEVSRLALPRAAGRLRDAGAAACGLAAAAVAARAFGTAGWEGAAVAVAAAALGWLALGRGVRPLAAAYAAAAAGAAASLLAALGHGGP
jgi:PTS system mannose-specific IID component